MGNIFYGGKKWWVKNFPGVGNFFFVTNPH